MEKEYEFLSENDLPSREEIDNVDLDVLHEKLQNSQDIINAAKEALVGYKGIDFDQV